ncbi:MAG TPA: acetate uptake transporter [Spirochaetia bacterium]|nr:acetate uptake transporter [Spirochaetia bacterium]
MEGNKVYEIREPGIGDPAGFAAGGFALTTFVLSVVNAGLVSPSVMGVFIPLALVYGGFAQLLGGMWEIKKGNTFGATVFTSFGSFWIAFALMFLFEGAKILNFGNYGNVALGLVLLAWTIFSIYMTIASFRVGVLMSILFILLLITLIPLMIGAFTGSEAAVHVAGYAGIVLALAAWYLSAACVINSVTGREVLSVGAFKKN